MEKGRKGKDEKVEEERQLSELPIELDEVKPALINEGARVRKEYGNLDELTLSLKEKGQIQPIAVMRYENTYKGFDYFLLGGGRRLMAIKELGWEKIAVRIYPPGLSAYEIKLIELEENIRRKSMTDAEYLISVKDIHDLWVLQYGAKVKTAKPTGHSMRDTATRLGLSIGSVSSAIEAADMIEKVPALAKLESITEIKRAIKNAKKKVVVDNSVAAYEEKVRKGTQSEMDKLLIDNYRLGNVFKKIKNIKSDTVNLVDLDIDFPIEVDDSIQHAKAAEERKSGIYGVISKEEYPEKMKEILKESYRILKDDGWCIVWFGREYFREIQEWAEEVGFKTHWNTGRWCQGAGYASTQVPYYRLGNTIQEFFYFSKKSAQIVVPHPDVFNFAPNPAEARTHPFEKPIELMTEIITTFTQAGAMIVVPFAGSGHTLLAAHNQNSTAIGWDISSEFKRRYIAKVTNLAR